MLPLTTASAGYGVFRIACEPYQKPKTAKAIKPITATVCTYSFFQSFFKVAVKAVPRLSGSILVDKAVYVIKLNASKKGKMRRLRVTIAQIALLVHA
jgi:hypothetical protein